MLFKAKYVGFEALKFHKRAYGISYTEKHTCKLLEYTSWWLNQPIWKIWVKMGIFPKVRGDKKRYLSCHHLVIIDQQRTKPSLSQKAVRVCFCYQKWTKPACSPKNNGFVVKSAHRCVNSKKRCWYQKCTQPAYTQNSQNNNLRMHVWLLMQVLKEGSCSTTDRFLFSRWNFKISNNWFRVEFELFSCHMHTACRIHDFCESAFWAGFLGSFYASWKGIRSTRVSTIYIFKTETWRHAYYACICNVLLLTVSLSLSLSLSESLVSSNTPPSQALTVAITRVYLCFNIFVYMYLAILCALFGMVKRPFQRLSDLQLGDQKVTAWITWYKIYILYTHVYIPIPFCVSSTLTKSYLTCMFFEVIELGIFIQGPSFCLARDCPFNELQKSLAGEKSCSTNIQKSSVVFPSCSLLPPFCKSWFWSGFWVPKHRTDTPEVSGGRPEKRSQGIFFST